MEPAILKMYGDIGEADKMMEMFGVEDDCISAKFVSDFLDEHPDETEVIVKINSRGGDVQEGWAILDLLTNSGKTIKTVGEGKVYSIATIIFLAGTEREMMKNADGMIHNPYIPEYTLAGKYEADDLEDIAETLRQEEAKILDHYVEKTGAEESKLADLMGEETKLSAEDMLELGFATKILEPVKAFAFNGNIKSKKSSIMTMNAADEKKFMGKVGDAIENALKKLNLSRIEPKDQTLKDKDGVEFTLDKETGAPAVGDKATPDGSYVMENGNTITIAGGEVTKVDEPVVDKTELELANEKITELEGKIADGETAKTEAETAKSEAETAKTEADEEKVKAVAIVTEMTALKNSWKPDGRQRAEINGKVGSIDLNRVKEIIKDKKEKSKNK
jgi:ATP-dependent Clp protease protease subunit